MSNDIREYILNEFIDPVDAFDAVNNVADAYDTYKWATKNPKDLTPRYLPKKKLKTVKTK